MFRFQLVRRLDSVYDPSYKTYKVWFRYEVIGYARVTTSREEARRIGVRHAWGYSRDGRTFTLLPGYTTRQECGRQLAVSRGLMADVGAAARRPSTTNRAARRTTMNGRGRGRVFGVEMEITSPDAGTIIRALRDAGVPMARRNLSSMRELPYDHTNTESNVWTLKHDGSVSGYGLELVSPKLSGEAGFNVVRTVCRVLNEIGATVDRTCGMHVHHDFRGMSVNDIRTSALFFLERQDSIMRLVAPSRRGNSYSAGWTQDMIETFRTAQLSQYNLGHFGRRGSLNLGAFGLHGSVEIRAHGGTVNANKVIAWIKFGQAIFAAAMAGTTVRGNGDGNTEGMLMDLSQHGLSDADSAILLRFVTSGESRSEVEARLASARAQVVELEELAAELV